MWFPTNVITRDVPIRSRLAIGANHMVSDSVRIGRYIPIRDWIYSHYFLSLLCGGTESETKELHLILHIWYAKKKTNTQRIQQVHSSNTGKDIEATNTCGYEVSGWQHILAFNSTQFKFNLFLLLMWVRECRQYRAHSSKGPWGQHSAVCGSKVGRRKGKRPL